MKTNHRFIEVELDWFSSAIRLPTPKYQRSGGCGVVEADLELFWNSWSAGFLGERLYLERIQPDTDCTVSSVGLVLRNREPMDAPLVFRLAYYFRHQPPTKQLAWRQERGVAMAMNATRRPRTESQHAGSCEEWQWP